MRRTVWSCSLFLALAFVALAAAPGDQRGRPAIRQIDTVMVGTFTFDVFPPYGPWDFVSRGSAAGVLGNPEFGLAKLYTAHTPNPAGDGTLVNTEFEIVTADGDTIRGTYSDGVVTEVPTELTEVDPYHPGDHFYDGRATFEVSGGTGRFAHARGTIDARFSERLNWTTWECSVAWALEGKIKH